MGSGDVTRPTGSEGLGQQVNDLPGPESNLGDVTRPPASEPIVHDDSSIDDPNIRPGDASARGGINVAPGTDSGIVIHYQPTDQQRADPILSPGSESGIVVHWKPIAFAVGAAIVIAVAAFSFLPGGSSPGATASPGGSGSTGAGPGASFNGPARAYITVNGTLHYLTGGFCSRQTADFGPDSAGPHDLWNVVFAQPNLDSFNMQLAWPGTVEDANFLDLHKPEWLISFKFGDMRFNAHLAEFGLAESQVVTAGLYRGPARVSWSGTYHDQAQDLPVSGVISCSGDLRLQTQSQAPSS